MASERVADVSGLDPGVVARHGRWKWALFVRRGAMMPRPAARNNPVMLRWPAILRYSSRQFADGYAKSRNDDDLETVDEGLHPIW